MDITVTIGPVATSSARVWLAAAGETMAILRDQRDLDVPWDVMDAFERYLVEWCAAAEIGNEFLWSATVDERIVMRIGLHWARITSVARSGRVPSIATAPPEAAAFYDAVSAGIAAGLARGGESASLADDFSDIVPAFDAQPRHDVAAAPIRVVLVDTDDDLRLLLRVRLEADGDFELVGEVSNAHAAVEAARAWQPDVMILDIDLPMTTGVDAVLLVCQAAPTTAVVVYSAEQRRLEALAAGAVAYVPKTSPIAAVIEAARHALRDVRVA